MKISTTEDTLITQGLNDAVTKLREIIKDSTSTKTDKLEAARLLIELFLSSRSS